MTSTILIFCSLFAIYPSQNSPGKGKSAFALRSEEIKKERPIAKASGWAWLISNMIYFFILSKNFKKNCMQRNRFYNGIISEIKLFKF